MATNPQSQSTSNAGLTVPEQSASQASSSSQGEQRPQQRPSPKTSLASQKEYNDIITVSNNCLYMSRILRKEMQSLHDEAFKFARGEFKHQPIEQTYQNFERLNKRILDINHFMERQASILPSEMPMLDGVKQVESIFSSELIEDYPKNYIIDQMIDSNNWREAQFQYFHYESLLLIRPYFLKSSQLRERRLCDVLVYDPEQSRHRKYQIALEDMKKEITAKNLGIYPKTLQMTKSSTIVEFVFGLTDGKKDSKLAITFKFLFLEKNGQVEYINIYGPQEDWVWDNDFYYKNIFPCQPSRFKVYQKLTNHANKLMRLHFGNMAHWRGTNLLSLVTIIGKFRDIFESKCVVCRKYLRDFLPPTVFELRNPHLPYHEACKYQ